MNGKGARESAGEGLGRRSTNTKGTVKMTETTRNFEDDLMPSPVTAAQIAVNLHQEDIEKISAALIEVADRKELCGEYDTFIDRLNSQLHVPLRTREKRYEVRVIVSYDVSIPVSAAKNTDDAEEQARRVNFIHHITESDLDDLRIMEVELADE